MSILEKLEYHLVRFIAGAVAWALFGSLLILLYTHAELGAMVICAFGLIVACWAFGDGLIASYEMWRKRRNNGSM